MAPRLLGQFGDLAGPLVLVFIGATMASVVLSAVGALLWLRGALRGLYDVDLVVASAFNACPLLFYALARYFGVHW